MSPKILIVRRDNIGDLICTLPLLSSLRKLFPEGRIDVLVNSYSAAVVNQHPDIDHVYVYTKVKHKNSEQTAFAVYWQRLKLTLSLRWQKYDWVVLANVSCIPRPLRWARQISGKRTVGFVTSENNAAGVITDPVPLNRTVPLHEVEYLLQLLRPFTEVPVEPVPTPTIYPRPENKHRLLKVLPTSFWKSKKPIIGLNISARKPSQQWSAANFISLISMLTPRYRCILYWSPGANDASGHPGDDDKAAQILRVCESDDVVGLPTATLDDLIAALDLQDIFITADGGAMHLGAALGKPVIALFGDSDPEQWRPWGVTQRILHPASRDVRDISPEVVMAQLTSLIEELGHA